MLLRVRTASGMTRITVDDKASLDQLRAKLEGETGIPAAQQRLLLGAPPAPISVSDGAAPLTSFLRHGDLLTVERIEQAPSPAPPLAAEAAPAAGLPPPPGAVSAAEQAFDAELQAALALSMQEHRASRKPSRPARGRSVHEAEKNPITTAMVDAEYTAVRRVIADDNSCLFNAIGYVLCGQRMDQAVEMRRLIAKTVAADAKTWTDAVLGRSNREYQQWILHPDHWGGGVELAILAKHFATEIMVFDTQTKRADTFGQGDGYSQRVFVIYDGIHYDALALNPVKDGPAELDVTVFSVDDSVAVDKAKALVAAAHAGGKFTNLASFTLRCDQCRKGLVGEADALKHAKATGHSQFSEYRD